MNCLGVDDRDVGGGVFPWARAPVVSSSRVVGVLLGEGDRPLKAGIVPDTGEHFVAKCIESQGSRAADPRLLFTNGCRFV